MAHDHTPAASARAGARHAGRLRIALLLTVTFLLVEAAAAFLTRSLALLSDAAHMLTDAVGVGMAVAAISLADRAAEGGRDGSRTFGLYRLEILAALANSVLLFGVAGYVLVEAGLRLGDEPDVKAVPMLVVAVIGLIVNLVAFVLLRAGARESVNVEGAYLEVLADLIGSVGVIAAAIVLATTGWEYADPIVAVAIGLWILPRTWNLARRSLRVLIEAAPPHLDLMLMRADLAALPGVVDVHDLHVWTLTSEMDVASAHLVTGVDTDAHGVLDQARVVLRDRYAIAHATLQVEPDTHEGCAEISW
ncbi:MAG: cation diffusion facilitator family transporter [Acidimicrobiia bacterium]